MAIPDYQECMLPVLTFLGDRLPHTRAELVPMVEDHFRLTDDERRRLLPSGKTAVIRSRVSWAIAYLKQAGLISIPRRGIYVITDRGLDVLRDKPRAIDLHFLETFPEFVEFRGRNRDRTPSASSDSAPVGTQGETPEETLETAFQALRARVEAEILENVKAASPEFFERIVVELLVAMGYGGSRKDAGEAIGRAGDGGIDGIVKEDRLGLDTIYVQAKRWEGTVGRPEIQKFAGALQGHRARKGVFLTTSSFTRDAIDYAERIETRIVLIDGPTLAQMMFDCDVGVVPGVAYVAKKVDGDYFIEE